MTLPNVSKHMAVCDPRVDGQNSDAIKAAIEESHKVTDRPSLLL